MEEVFAAAFFDELGKLGFAMDPKTKKEIAKQIRKFLTAKAPKPKAHIVTMKTTP